MVSVEPSPRHPNHIDEAHHMIFKTWGGGVLQSHRNVYNFKTFYNSDNNENTVMGINWIQLALHMVQ
jgi:hypothetical protein